MLQMRLQGTVMVAEEEEEEEEEEKEKEKEEVMTLSSCVAT